MQLFLKVLKVLFLKVFILQINLNTRRILKQKYLDSKNNLKIFILQ
jgi:hypothetical protein